MAVKFNTLYGLCLKCNICKKYKLFKQELEIYFKATETNIKKNCVQITKLLNLTKRFKSIQYNKKNQRKKKLSNQYLRPLRNIVFLK